MSRTAPGAARLLLCGALAVMPALAEPYIAVREGLTCGQCHVNRTGGGMRTAFGTGVGREALPQRTFAEAWDGVVIADRLRVGADLRASADGEFQDGGPFIGEYRLRSTNVYVQVDVLPERLTLYVDEDLSGGATNRETFALYRGERAGLWVKAGKFFLPFGTRLLDDDASTRRATGFTFESADNGVELGVEPGDWSVALALTNGTQGAAETDNGKQLSARAEYVRRTWRAGASVSENDLPGADRQSVHGLHVGLRSGPLVWIAELDRIESRRGASRVEGEALWLQLSWIVRRGITLRAWGGKADPDRSLGGDSAEQQGLGLDWTPISGVQLRGWYRFRDGPPAVAGAKDDVASLELHLYF